MSLETALQTIDSFATTARAEYVALVRQVVEKPDGALDPRHVRDVLSAVSKTGDELRADVAAMQERFNAYFSDSTRDELQRAEDKLGLEVDRLKKVFERTEETEGAKITAARKLIDAAEGALIEKRNEKFKVYCDISNRAKNAKEVLGGEHWLDESLLFPSR
jgi:hypothetical protein